MIVCTENVFTLHTTHTSYQLAVAPNGMVLHTYYGTRLPEDVPSLADAPQRPRLLAGSFAAGAFRLRHR